jgi:ribosomal subunit interface protein
MQIRVSGKHMEVGEALPEQVRTRLAAAIEKHFDRGSSASVVFSKERTGFHAECTLHLDSGMVMQAEGKGDDAYRAFDEVLRHVQKQVRHHLDKLKQHHHVTKDARDADA